MSRWSWLAVVCLGCVAPTSQLPPAEMLLAEPMAGGFVLGDDSLDWSTYEEVGGQFVQTFHRREPLASAPRVIATYAADARQRGVAGRVGDALLIGTPGSYDWCQWYGLLAPGATEPTHVPLPRTGVPDHEPCWALPLGWHGGRMLYRADFVRETIYDTVVEGQEVVAFDFASREWTVLDYGPSIELAAFDSGRLVVWWETDPGEGFRLHDLASYNDRNMSVDVRDLRAMTATNGAVVFAERPFAGVIGPLYRATSEAVSVFADLGVYVDRLFTDGDDVWAVARGDLDGHLIRIGSDGAQTWYPFPPRYIIEHRPGALLLFDGEAGELWLQPLPR